MPRHQLTDEQWEFIADLLPESAKTGRPPTDRRMTLNAIFWVLRTGSAWRDVPTEYGRGKTVWQWFDRWNDDGTLDSILDRLRKYFIDAGEIDDQLWCVDGTIVRAARCATGGGKKKIPRNRRITR